MGSKTDRVEVKQITKQWVSDNCKYITERDMGLLRLLVDNKRRILRRDQIEVLYPEFASTDRLNKRLANLYRLHVIDRVYPPKGLGEGSSKQHICLDKAGAILLGMEKYVKPISDKDGVKSFINGWEHKVLINDYECRVVSMMRELEGSVLHYSAEQQYLYNGYKIIPDMIMVLKVNGFGVPVVIEVDRGTEDLTVIQNKLKSYSQYKMSREWITEKWARIFKKPVFPTIFFMTEDRGRRVQSIKEYGRELGLSIVVGGHTQFEELLKGSLRNT